MLAATSHVDSTFGLSPAELTHARAAVAESLATKEIALKLVQGGEVSPGRLPDLSDDDLRALTLGDGPWILLECPFSPVASTMDLVVTDLQRLGFRVLLAHPERSPSFQREPARLARLIERGARAQVTAGSLAGDFGAGVRRSALRLLEAGLVHSLASDAHDHRHRPPLLSSARGKGKAYKRRPFRGGETRTRTGDTTIFSRAGLASEASRDLQGFSSFVRLV